MRTNLLYSAAIALGMGAFTATGFTYAQSPYSSPSRWNNFRTVSDTIDEVASSVENLPAPVAESSTNSAYSEATPYSQPATSAPIGTGCAPCQSGAAHVSPYSQAASAPWSGQSYGGSCNSGSCGASRPSLSPYFGGFNLLFMSLEEGQGRTIASGLGTDFTTALVDPSNSLGFDISAGRYLDCGRFGLGMTYFNWNPSQESITRLGAAGTIRATNPPYRDVSIDVGGAGIDTVYNYIDGTGPSPGATGVRATRDLSFQGLEANLFSFGLMGAQRAAYAGCNSGSPLGKFGRGLGLSNGGGYGGAAGPLVRSNSGRVRVTTSHGFRWMQIKDSTEFAYNIDGTAGYQAEDLYDNVDIENNLLGYQFGSFLTYCLGKGLDLNIGGKFGIYGNRAEMRHRLGTQTTLAYLNGVPADVIDTESSDTVLATLGELDLGLGYRISNAWTIRGGYRLMGITGVANSVDSFPYAYGSVAGSGQVFADDSYVLHGGYVGLQCNW